MLITITVISILGLTALVRLAGKILPFNVCSICAGVSLTWAGLLAAHFLGYSVDLIVPALLMGGTVVGIAYQLEKKFRNISTGQLLLWKTLFIPAGFVAAYGILLQLWVVALLAIALLFLLISLLFLSSTPKANPPLAESDNPDAHEKVAEEIEKKMKDCC